MLKIFSLQLLEVAVEMWYYGNVDNVKREWQVPSEITRAAFLPGKYVNNVAGRT